MTVLQLLIRNLSYYWRTNLAVIAGVIAATAVIGGALVVGDSVRDSLKQMSLDRLGKIDHAINGPRFFRQELAEELENASELAVKAAPVLIMRGTLEFEPSQEDDVNEAESESVAPVMNRVGQVNVYGLTDSAWGLLETGDVAVPGETEIVLNRSVADQLHANVGDEVSLIVEIPATIPRDSLLGERNETIAALPVTVSAITADELGVSRLGLNPNQQLPTNAYVNLGELQALVGLQEVERSKLNPIAKPARINGTFIAAARTEAVSDPLSLGSADTLTSSLKSQLTLEDLSLRLVQNEEHGYLSLESEQMFLEESVSDAALRTAEQMGVDTSPVLVYLLNEIRKPETPDQFSMYSVIAGIEPTDATPFGPFEFVGEHEPLTGNNVYLNHVVAEDIGAGVNDTINVKYHVVGDRGELPEDERQFHVAGIVKLAGVVDETGYTAKVSGV
ncbi:MAG: hypothetical protein KDA80_22905, partial [Planctomycetaceae bacterium]|nr:hypothetical protein [Planctomycetaceae bacterium]